MSKPQSAPAERSYYIVAIGGERRRMLCSETASRSRESELFERDIRRLDPFQRMRDVGVPDRSDERRAP